VADRRGLDFVSTIAGRRDGVVCPQFSNNVDIARRGVERPFIHSARARGRSQFQPTASIFYTVVYSAFIHKTVSARRKLGSDAELSIRSFNWRERCGEQFLAAGRGWSAIPRKRYLRSCPQSTLFSSGHWSIKLDNAEHPSAIS
jgi:hypothetical protein